MAGACGEGGECGGDGGDALSWFVGVDSGDHERGSFRSEVSRRCVAGRAGCPAAVGCRGSAGGVAGQGSGCLVASGKRSVTAGVVDGIGLPLTRRGPRWHTSPTCLAEQTVSKFPISACCWLVCMLGLAVLMASRRCLAWSVGPGITGARPPAQDRIHVHRHSSVVDVVAAVGCRRFQSVYQVVQMLAG